MITGVGSGGVEEFEVPPRREMRGRDKRVDELAKGRTMDKLPR